MKKRRMGFATIECIVSMTIICIGIYIISNALYNSYSFTNYNKKRFDMLNIAKSTIEDVKYNIKNEVYTDVNSDYIEVEDYSYKVNTIIEKSTEYYQCYKINVVVSNEDTNIRLESYVLQQ
ncbi:MAG: hypothetical protein ACRC3Y_13755 [Romboutsia sp.]|uniref:hypothetical protein n=1 Tax=Romboutsia sp. TaxID=1965302 RepID=UPI003F377303